MSGQEPSDTPGVAHAGSFLERWSRRKAEARSRDSRAAVQAAAAANEPVSPTAADATPHAPPPSPPLPDLDQLGENSDYSAFLAPDVDAALRRTALRKLFHSPKFNVFDGLDTYRDDFTGFPALGSIVTADMRHRLEQAAREWAARAGQDLAGDAPATGAAVPASTSVPTSRNEDDADHGPA